jgi:hypothetical protein
VDPVSPQQFPEEQLPIGLELELADALYCGPLDVMVIVTFAMPAVATSWKKLPTLVIQVC